MANGGEAGASAKKRFRRVRTPTVLQMEAVECGAASLGIVLGYFGRFVPLEELRVSTGVSRDGARALNIVKAARSYGMIAQGVKAESDEALAMAPPFIVFWNFNHFLVVEGATAKWVFLNDPASGPTRMTHQEFDASFTGVVLDLKPGPGFQKGGQRQSVIKSLWRRLGGTKNVLVLIMLINLMLVVPGLLMPAFLKSFIDDILVRGYNDWLFPLVIGLVLAAVINGLLTYLQQRYLLRVQFKITVKLAAEFFWHVVRLPSVFYTQRYIGDIAARVQSINRIAQKLSGPAPTAIVNSFMIVFYALVMSVYSVVLTAIAAALTAFNILAVRMVQRKRSDLNSHYLNQSAKLSGASMAGLQSIETLKATGTENDFFTTWAGYQSNMINTHQRLGVYSAMLNAAPQLLGQLTTAAVLGVGALLIIDGQLSIGGLVAFQALMTHFTGPVQQLVGFGGQLQEVTGDINRLDDVLKYKLDTILKTDDTDSDDEPGPKLSGAIELRHVCFGYSPLDPPLITNVDLTIAPGKRVAFVGTTGSGKSTMAKLIVGLYQPTSGDILYDGKPIAEIPRSVFTTSVSMVDQDITLFEGSIRDNISMWDPTLPRSAIIRAAKDAEIHDVIAGRPGGYESDVAENGANFSGGQRQRIEIARSLVRNPTVLVLDEATASLDPLTEQAIDDNLRRRGCACVIIAHRLSTIRDCDEIIVLDRGQIVERGNHAELMKAQGHYAELVAMQ